MEELNNIGALFSEFDSGTKSLLKPEPQFRNGYKDKKRLADIHQLPCSLCFLHGLKQTTKTIAHHKMGGGMGKKASDLLTMSLCEIHHTRGQEAIHHIGRLAWQEWFGTTEDDLIEITNKMLEKLN
jgi:hypothetical protein